MKIITLAVNRPSVKASFEGVFMSLFSKDAFGNCVFVGDLVKVYSGGSHYDIGTVLEINQYNLFMIKLFKYGDYFFSQNEFRKITVEEATLLMLES
jgi:hypothetical protein